MATTRLHTYAPDQIKIIFKGIEVRGIKKGTFVKVTRSQPVWTDQMSGDGQDMTRIQSLDKSGMIEITLEGGSETNRQFSDILASDEESNDGVGTASVRDLNGNDKHTSESAWFTEFPGGEYAEGPGDKVWKLRCRDLKTFSGGSVR